MWASGDPESHHYARGRGRDGHHERDSPHLGRRMADVGHLRAGTPVGVLPRGVGALHRDNDRVHGPCRDPYHDPFRGHRDLGVDHGRLRLSGHGPCPCPYHYPRDGLDERSGDGPGHRDDGESGL